LLKIAGLFFLNIYSTIYYTFAQGSLQKLLEDVDLEKLLSLIASKSPNYFPSPNSL